MAVTQTHSMIPIWLEMPERLLKLLPKHTSVRLRCCSGAASYLNGKRGVIVNDPSLAGDDEYMQARKARRKQAMQEFRKDLRRRTLDELQQLQHDLPMHSTIPSPPSPSEYKYE
eukprot:1809083-Karenia_brevis.AAC.1